MKTFIFERINAGHSIKLKQELEWLSGFGLKVCGIKTNPSDGSAIKGANIFAHVLKKNSRCSYLRRLGKLLENPIFYEFGWDKELYINLQKAIFQSKSTLMKLRKKNWVVLVSPKKIEITKRDRKTMHILINEKDFNRYISLKDEVALRKLNRSIGLFGLKMVESINRSKKAALLPDQDRSKNFTLFFSEDLLKKA